MSTFISSCGSSRDQSFQKQGWMDDKQIPGLAWRGKLGDANK